MRKTKMLIFSLALGGMVFLTGCLSVEFRRAVEVEEVIEVPVVEEIIEVPVVEEIIEVPVVEEPVEVIEELVTTHTVVRGETLSHIALRIYGDPEKWRLIFEANRDILDRPEDIRPGQVLVIPWVVEEPVEVPVEVIDELVTTHTVARGETLWDIAERVYGDPLKWRLIFEANRDIMDNPDDLRLGQVLVIPRK